MYLTLATMRLGKPYKYHSRHFLLCCIDELSYWGV
jgi:hypothetical protein